MSATRSADDRTKWGQMKSSQWGQISPSFLLARGCHEAPGRKRRRREPRLRGLVLTPGVATSRRDAALGQLAGRAALAQQLDRLTPDDSAYAGRVRGTSDTILSRPEGESPLPTKRGPLQVFADRRRRHRRGLGRRLAANGPLGRRRPGARGVHRALRLSRARRRRGPGAALRRRPVLPQRSLPGLDRLPHRPTTPSPRPTACVEKFIQTLKEQVLWIERFETLDELRTRIRRFARDFNEHRLLERHGYRTPMPGPRRPPSGRPGMIAVFSQAGVR
jgi:hypothetical protein